MTEGHAWEILFQAEINMATNARSEGNEGKARVCARRAVGIVLGEYFQRNHILLDSPSAYNRLRFIGRTPNIPDDLKTKIQHFLVRVNSDFSLSIDTDLITEAQQVREILLGGE